MFVVHCLIENMWAGVLTKMLKVRPYKVIYSELMNMDMNIEWKYSAVITT